MISESAACDKDHREAGHVFPRFASACLASILEDDALSYVRGATPLKGSLDHAKTHPSQGTHPAQMVWAAGRRLQDLLQKPSWARDQLPLTPSAPPTQIAGLLALQRSPLSPFAGFVSTPTAGDPFSF